MHGAHSLIRMAEAFQEQTILLLLDFQLLLALFLRFPGGDFFRGGGGGNGFDHSAVVAQDIVTTFGRFLGNGVADNQPSVFIRVTVHGCLGAGRKQQSEGRNAGNNRRNGQMVTHSSDSVAVPVAGHVLRMAGKFRIGLQVVQYLFKTNDADNGDAELFLDFLDGG